MLVADWNNLTPPGRAGGTDFAYSYEKIWEEMTDMERFLAKLPADKEEYW